MTSATRRDFSWGQDARRREGGKHESQFSVAVGVSDSDLREPNSNPHPTREAGSVPFGPAILYLTNLLQRIVVRIDGESKMIKQLFRFSMGRKMEGRASGQAAGRKEGMARVNGE